jgi:hypothetical protein
VLADVYVEIASQINRDECTQTRQTQQFSVRVEHKTDSHGRRKSFELYRECPAENFSISPADVVAYYPFGPKSCHQTRFCVNTDCLSRQQQHTQHPLTVSKEKRSNESFVRAFAAVELLENHSTSDFF